MDLGTAFQLTNFLRDVAEDVDRGRIYLPLEDLARFGVTGDRLLDAFTGILAAVRGVLRADGVVVITTRPWRRGGVLVDFPAAVTAAGEHAGLVLVERNVALLAGVRGETAGPSARRIRRSAVAGMNTLRTPILAIRSNACSGSKRGARNATPTSRDVARRLTSKCPRLVTARGPASPSRI